MVRIKLNWPICSSTVYRLWREGKSYRNHSHHPQERMAAAQWVQANVAANGLAVITLDRSKALNAMNLEMDIIYKKHLDEWAAQPAVKSVLIQSSSSRAFCAGMDIKGVAAALQEDKASTLPYQLERTRITNKIHIKLTSSGGYIMRPGSSGAEQGGDIKQMHNHNSDSGMGMFETALKVFEAEYSLICEISNYKKPYISLMDGITMGFGIGLSGHGRYRIVTEKTVLAMPENGIGLFPDVGFAHIAARSPGGGAVGAYLALTGARITDPADALYLGVASHYVPSQDLPSLKEAFQQLDLSGDAHKEVEEVLATYSKTPESEPKLKNLLPAITSCFGSKKSVSEIIEALKAVQESEDSAVVEWAKGALEGLKKGAPLSLCVTQRHFADVAEAVSKGDHPLAQIEGVMRKEYSLGTKTSMRPDFLEGVRAVLIDKDQKPRWRPASVEEVDQRELEELLAPLEGHRPPF